MEKYILLQTFNPINSSWFDVSFWPASLAEAFKLIKKMNFVLFDSFDSFDFLVAILLIQPQQQQRNTKDHYLTNWFGPGLSFDVEFMNTISIYIYIWYIYIMFVIIVLK